MTSWLDFLSSPDNGDLLSMVVRHPPRLVNKYEPYRMTVLSTEPGRIMAVVVGKVIGEYCDRFVVIDPEGPLAWKALGRRMLRLVNKESPRCVFLVCGIQGDTMLPEINRGHVVVRLPCDEITVDEADGIIKTVASK